ncbi:bifunctional hydroxymethylpyrimidine kinase/phosphomethylpyrimidine kinase [Elioraea tepida]|jgi:hydroxymethylpyrimidine/phosphomethylpyrimidine kinase|uniref:hydroxymethylpyrimidine kinase n=1 Tax=Elioraea tepida TaxID=2843330 RepID=A0A975U370_9PROT|nr:bifunctional hydroxymethylpyrimidine kinase/phosphomethylpyrimidine kinase [Elioraea tepida]QXM25440.1 bifunctional hydroxymethylpyrimidine kinase/phosphomethylpyrimidine kinase [Elioraea tepida]
MQGRVLIVAGSDSGGGAGIQADIKAVTALGAFAMTAVTALTAQNTEGVEGVFPVPPAFIREQMGVVIADLGVDSVKTGMLHDAAVIEAVAEEITLRLPGIPVVVDPVMVAKGGHRLLEESAVEALIRLLIPLASVITPNVPEAEALVGAAILDVADMRRVAEELLGRGARAVLLKGGHLPGERVTDLLATAEGIEAFESPRLETRHTHGTGCTLASAIAAGLAQGMSLRESVIRARHYVLLAMASAPGYGRGHGPLDHAVTVDPARVAALSRR